MVFERGQIDDEVLAVSEHLDELIVEYHKLYLDVCPESIINAAEVNLLLK